MNRGIEIIEEPRGLTLSQQVKDRFFNATHARSELSNKLIEGTDRGRPQQYVVFAHGGAGSPTEFIHNLRMVGTDGAAQLGEQLIASGIMSPLDVAIQMVAFMEYDINLIAGIGSGPNKKGRYQFDAFVRTPDDMGIVTAIGRVKNPIFAAEIVRKYTSSLHITGKDATELAHDHHLPFYTKREMTKGYRRGAESREGIYTPTSDTVGAIVAAKWNDHWEIATAGSTGGMPDKDPGRVGDTGHPGTGFHAGKESNNSNYGTYPIFSRVAAALVSGIGEATMLNLTAAGWVERVLQSGSIGVGDFGQMNKIVKTNINGKKGWGGMVGMYIDNLIQNFKPEEQQANILISQSSDYFAVAAYSNVPSARMHVLPKQTGMYIRDLTPKIIPIYSSLS